MWLYTWLALMSKNAKAHCFMILEMVINLWVTLWKYWTQCWCQINGPKTRNCHKPCIYPQLCLSPNHKQSQCLQVGFLLYYVIDNNRIRYINYCACHSYVKYKCCRPIRTPRISVRSYSLPKLWDQGVRMLRWRSEAQFIKISLRPTSTINDSGMGCLSHFILAQRIGLPFENFWIYAMRNKTFQITNCYDAHIITLTTVTMLCCVY